MKRQPSGVISAAETSTILAALRYYQEALINRCSKAHVLLRPEIQDIATFAEKPDREVINALKAAGFRWGGGTWMGYREKLPVSVLAMTEVAS